jgi:branched-chain amino acid transport system ATP-binding protein
MLNIENLSVAYGKIAAIKEVSLHLDAGEIVAIIGANGAGKSTLINAVSGVVPVQSGTVRFQDAEIHKMPAWKIARQGVVQIPEGRKVFPKMTVRENLEMGAYAEKNAADTLRHAEEMETMFPVLRERRNQLAGTLSGGEQQMLAIARGLMARPKLLMFDEPSMGLSPVMVEKVFQIIRTIHQQGITVLLVEQNAKKSLQIAERAYVLETGRITLADTGANLLENALVKRAYLGIAS